MANLQ